MTLYKYAGANSGAMILDGLRLKVTPPNELNDPFELTPCSRNLMSREYVLKSLTINPEQARPAYAEACGRYGYTHSFEEFVRDVEFSFPGYYKIFRAKCREALIRHDLELIHEASRHLLVLCLSAINNSIAMWSHYGDHHRGIVLGVNSRANCFNFGSEPTEITYSAKRVSLDWTVVPQPDDVKTKVDEIVLTKSKNWKYEREYRICFPIRDGVIKQSRDGGGFNYLINIWAATIQEVIFGCCISAADEARIRGLLALKRFRHVRLLRAARHAKKFKIDIVAA